MTVRITKDERHMISAFISASLIFFILRAVINIFNYCKEEKA